MSEPTQMYPGLDVETDPAFVRGSARVQRAAHWAVALALSAAVLGMCGGGGLLSRATVSDGPLVARFDRFARLDAPVRIDLALPPGAEAFQMDAAYAGALSLERVTPAPSAERATSSGVRFAVDGERVVIRARPDRFGRIGGRITSEGRTVDVRHLVYP